MEGIYTCPLVNYECGHEQNLWPTIPGLHLQGPLEITNGGRDSGVFPTQSLLKPKSY